MLTVFCILLAFDIVIRMAAYGRNIQNSQQAAKLEDILLQLVSKRGSELPEQTLADQLPESVRLVRILLRHFPSQQVHTLHSAAAAGLSVELQIRGNGGDIKPEAAADVVAALRELYAAAGNTAKICIIFPDGESRLVTDSQFSNFCSEWDTVKFQVSCDAE